MSFENVDVESDPRALTNLGPTNLGVSLQQLKVLNALAFVCTITFNFLAASGVLSPYSVGDVSSMNRPLITPAGGAFSIWSIIYVIEAFFILYSLFGPRSRSEDAVLLHGVGFWFVLVCLLNSLWIVTFVQGNTASLWCSTVLISSLLFSLCKIHLRATCWGRRHPGGWLQRCAQTVALDIHFSMYAGWMTVATIANISGALMTTGWEGEPFSKSTWVVLMLCVALLLNSYIVVTRQDCVWGFVLGWSSYFIFVANKGNKTVATASLVVCSFIVVISAVVTTRVLSRAWGSRFLDTQVLPR